MAGTVDTKFVKYEVKDRIAYITLNRPEAMNALSQGLLARARVWVLIPLIAVFAAASTWFGLYLMTVGWAP